MSDNKKVCDTCKHWDGNTYSDVFKTLRKNTKPEPEYSSDTYVTWPCNCSKFVKGYGIPEHERPIDGAILESDEGWGMETGPEFGCIHWSSNDHQTAIK